MERERSISLRELLQSLFSANEAVQFVSDFYGETVLNEVDWEGAWARVVENWIGVFERRGLVNEEFFDALLAARADRASDIERARSGWREQCREEPHFSNSESHSVPPTSVRLIAPKLPAALIFVLCAIAAGVAELRGAFDSVPFVNSVGRGIRYLVLLLLTGACLYIWVAASRRRAHRHGSTDEADTRARQQSFEGREKAVSNLLRHCSNYRLVFLRGASGVGKSALIMRGISSTLHSKSPFHLVVMQHWGDSWEQGPAGWLARELRATLDPNSVAELEEPDNLPDLVRSISRLVGKEVLVAFDQFDDYQIRFTDRLYLAEESRYLSPHELMGENAFWSDVAGLVEEGVMRCIFITRSDVVGALGSVRFAEPQEMYLQRLDSTAARKLLRTQLRRASISVAERGLLIDHIADDLEDDGGVLPAQLHAACEALAHLSPLSYASYVAKGLMGLQTDQLSARIAAASNAASVEPDVALEILCAMVDPQPSPPKARVRSLATLLDSACNRLEQDALDRLLTVLAEDNIVREVPSSPPQWTLYHDYVAHIAKELQARANRWSAHLHTATAQLERSRGLLQRWNALLSPLDQLLLLYHSAASRARYGKLRLYQHRRIVLWSALRWTPYLVVAAMGLVIYFGTLTKDRTQNIIAQFSFGDAFPSDDETTALWTLRAAAPDVQDEFIDQMIKVEGRAARFAEHGEMVIHAIVDVDQRRRDDVLANMRRKCHGSAKLAADSIQACVRIALALESDDLRDWNFALDHWLAQIDDATRLPQQRHGVHALTRWLSADAAVRHIPKPAAEHLIRGAAELSRRPHMDLLGLQTLSVLIARVPTSGRASELMSLQHAVRTARLSGASAREREVRRFVAWWPIAAALGTDADTDTMASNLSQLTVHSSEVEPWVEDAPTMRGRANMTLLRRLVVSIKKLPANELRAWLALERLLQRIQLDSDDREEADTLIRHAKARLMRSPAPSPSMESAHDRSRRRLAQLRRRLG